MEKPKAYTGKDKYIFVSYSHKDNEKVYPFILALQEKYNVWFDEGIHFGSEWEEEIADKLLNCELFIFIVSQNSLDSTNCKDEIHLAREEEKNFINIILEDFKFPSFFSLRYARYQSCQLYRYEDIKEAIKDMERKCEWFKPCLKLKQKHENKQTHETNSHIGYEEISTAIDDETSFALSILSDNPHENEYDTENKEYANEMMGNIRNVFQELKYDVGIDLYAICPTVTLYGLYFDGKTSDKEFKRNIKEFSIRLGGMAIRYVDSLIDQNRPFLEIPNKKRNYIYLKQALRGIPDCSKKPLSICLGVDYSFKPLYVDLTTLPHLLIGGTTGSGKSMFLHSLIATLILRNSPDQLKLALIDEKMVEFNCYNNLPHLITPVASSTNYDLHLLIILNKIMEQRFNLLVQESASNIVEYNKIAAEKGKEILSYIILIVDECADCFYGRPEMHERAVSLAQKGRAVGIHVILSTQVPIPKIINGTLKANLPARIAFAAANDTDSNVVLGKPDAELLLGSGDALLQTPANSFALERVQTPYISMQDTKRIVSYLATKYKKT